MPRTLTPSQTPSGSPSAPGSTTIPVPLVDQVTVGSITPMAKAAINNAAYLAALLLGTQNAPPNAQPPAIVATTTGGPGSGPCKLQTFLTPTAMAAAAANPGDIALVANVNGDYTGSYGLFIWNPNIPQTSANGTTIIAKAPPQANGCWIWVGHYLLNAANGIAGLDLAGYLQLPPASQVAQFSPLTSNIDYHGNWASDSTYPFGYWKDATGLVHLEGVIDSTSTDDSEALLLPAGYAPEVTRTIPIAISGTLEYAPALAQIYGYETDFPGLLYIIYGFTAGRSYDLTGVSFRAYIEPA